VSEGGLAVTLAECCFDTNGIGVSVDLPAAAGEPWAGASAVTSVADEQTLFGESAPLVVVSAQASRTDAVLAKAKAAGVPARAIGRTGGSHVRVAIGGREVLVLTVAEAEHAWGTAIEARMTSRRAGAA
jgi:phosphoribosylformylglycinamidine (FGAM) synthase-like enzyme